MAAAVATLQQPTKQYLPQGGAHELMLCRNAEVVLDGPANTGKSYAGLWKMHLAAIKYPGMHGLLLRKTLVSLKASTLVTFRERILGADSPVRYWTARGDEPAHYAYPNGSKVYVGGMDNARKLMSTEYDLVVWDEATDGEVDEWEALGTRMRYGVMPYQQLIGCVNPQAPTHWLNQRMLVGRTTRLLSRHEDNPTCTLEYLQRLSELTGVRRKRLFLGIWAAADGTVYEGAWDPERNHPPRKAYSTRPDSLWGDCGINRDWPRYMAIDWGYRAPLSVQWYGRPPDGDLILYREIYVTMRTVETVAKEALAYMGWRMEPSGQLVPTRTDCDPLPREIVADVDPGDRATWEMHFGLRVFPATKGKDSISDGIQAVTRRLSEGRLKVLQHSLVERDPLLDERKQPCGFAEEVESYIWDTRAGRAPREVPMDDHDHAMDAARYLVQYFDREPQTGGSISFEAVGF